MQSQAAVGALSSGLAAAAGSPISLDDKMNMMNEAKILPDRSDLIDRAWLILFGAALCMFCGQAAAILFTFGIFAPEIVADTGWSAVSIASAIAPGAMFGALMAPIVGRAADRFGARPLVIIGGPAYAAGFALLAYASVSPTTFIICLAIACALGFAAIPILYAQVASGWFARRRGLALSLIFTATSVGVAFWSIYASALLANVGWRHAYALMGATAGAIILLAGIFLIRNPPATSSKDRTQPALAGVGVAEALKTATFWKLMVAFILVTAVLAGSTVTLPTVLRNMGVSSAIAASVIPVVGIGMFVGRLSAGVLLDRWFAPRVTATYISLALLGMALMLIAPGPVAFFVAAALLGLGIGAEMDAAAYMVSRAFGLRAFGGIYGFLTLGYGVSGALGTGAIGAALAASVAPSLIFAIGVGLLVIAIILFLSLRRQNFPFYEES